MQKLARILAAALLIAAFAGPAKADYVSYSWSDIFDPNPDWIVPPSRTYTHDLKDGADGFRPLVDLITTFSLVVELYDDGLDGLEVALVDVAGWLGDQLFFGVGGAEFGGWSIQGWVELNLTGTYTVSITSVTGDFYFGKSTLYATGFRYVSEPGTLALLALGLIGLGLAASRRAKWARTQGLH